MSRVSLCCSNSHGTVLDRRIVEIDNLFAARQSALDFIRAFSAKSTLSNWRDYCLHTQDGRGSDMFVLPFWSTLSRLTLTSTRSSLFAEFLDAIEIEPAGCTPSSDAAGNFRSKFLVEMVRACGDRLRWHRSRQLCHRAPRRPEVLAEFALQVPLHAGG
jgi:hypothetical protein